MKNIRFAIMILIFVAAGVACTINVPWDTMEDYDGVRVVMHVVPDDADVLLNGRFIGAAYEFASPGSALRLASRLNELVFKKKGFREKAVDLRSFSSRNITVKAEMEAEPAPTASAAEPALAAPVEDRKAYEAESEPVPPLPVEKPAPPEDRYLTQITLTVSPEETAVYIDGNFWGLAPTKGNTASLRLPPGKYTFSAFKPGFKVYSQEVVVPKREKFALAIALQQ